MDNVVEFCGRKFLKVEYLGDGAYVGYTGWSIVLMTSDGLGIQNEVHLEDREWITLTRFVRDLKNED